MWAKEEECRQIVKRIWLKKEEIVGSDRIILNGIQYKILQTGTQIGRWGFNKYRKRAALIKDKEGQLAGMHEGEVGACGLRNIMELKEDINLLKRDEEAFWAQKSRIQWLQLGDSNTRYFHQVVAQRRRSNRIEALVDDLGNRATNMASMGQVVNSFYSGLFSSSGSHGLEEVFSGWNICLNRRQKNVLKRTFVAKEVEVALSQMAPSKAKYYPLKLSITRILRSCMRS